MTALPQTCSFRLPCWPQEEGGLGQAGPGGTAHLRSAFGQELSLAQSHWVPAAGSPRRLGGSWGQGLSFPGGVLSRLSLGWGTWPWLRPSTTCSGPLVSAGWALASLPILLPWVTRETRVLQVPGGNHAWLEWAGYVQRNPPFLSPQLQFQLQLQLPLQLQLQLL